MGYPGPLRRQTRPSEDAPLSDRRSAAEETGPVAVAGWAEAAEGRAEERGRGQAGRAELAPVAVAAGAPALAPVERSP